MCTNLLLLVLICAIGGSHTADLTRCSNGTELGQTSFTSYEGEVAGRYLFERCLDVEPEATSWEVHVSFFDTDTRCKHPPYRGIHAPGRAHSYFYHEMETDSNCSHVCLSATFDLIFAACYCIQSTVMIDGHSRYINYSYFNIFNNYTKDNIITNQAQVEILNQDDENVTIEWHTGVPFDGFKILICDWDNATNAVAEEAACARVEPAACRARRGTALACGARLAPARCHQLRLTLEAAWVTGLFTKQGLVLYEYCAGGAAAPAPAVRGWPWPWALGGAAVLLAGVAAARVLCRTRQARNLHKAVLKEWLVHRVEPPAAPPAAARARVVLLLYAREGPALARLAAALQHMLEAAPGTQVYDLYSAATMARAAAAPGAWLRALLACPDTRVLLLQAPALCRDPGAPGRLQSPLLGQRVAYREPQYGDSLLQYAVRLISEAPREHADYKKYYLATLAALPVETLPALVPYRRYALPGAAALLARDVCGGAPAAAAVARVAAAAREVADLARDRPDYLADHLVLA